MPSRREMLAALAAAAAGGGRSEPHRFVDIEEDLTLIVFFSKAKPTRSRKG